MITLAELKAEKEKIDKGCGLIWFTDKRNQCGQGHNVNYILCLKCLPVSNALAKGIELAEEILKEKNKEIMEILEIAHKYPFAVSLSLYETMSKQMIENLNKFKDTIEGKA